MAIAPMIQRPTTTNLTLARTTLSLAFFVPYLALPMAITVVRRAAASGVIHPVARWSFWVSYAAAVAFTAVTAAAIILLIAASVPR